MVENQGLRDKKHMDSVPKKLQVAHYPKFIKEKNWLTQIWFLYFKILSELWQYLALINVSWGDSQAFFHSEGYTVSITSLSPILDYTVISKLPKSLSHTSFPWNGFYGNPSPSNELRPHSKENLISP